ncbi:YkyA family protein [Bacillus sp. EB600]|nr:YkyA family protein [Bacillus sp. EB600]
MNGLGVQQYDERVTLSNDTLTMVSERKKYMEKETKSLQKSEKIFKKIAAMKMEIDDKKLKKQVNELYDLMISRYRAHDVLNKEYLNGRTYDQQLYVMLKDKNVSIDKWGAQVEMVNTTYKKIYAANDQFNKLTEKYNDIKLLFYKKAGLVKI